MTKSLISATIDTETCVLAYQKIPNVSAFIENALRIELKLIDESKEKSKDEIIRTLEVQNAKLLTEIGNLKKEVIATRTTGGRVVW